MSAALLYILGCIGFVLALGGGLVVAGMLIGEVEVGGIAATRRKRFSITDAGDYVQPVIVLLVGIFLFVCGWPA